MSWLNSDDKYHENFFIVAYIFQQHPHIKWITGMLTVWDKMADSIKCSQNFQNGIGKNIFKGFLNNSAFSRKVLFLKEIYE